MYKRIREKFLKDNEINYERYLYFGVIHIIICMSYNFYSNITLLFIFFLLNPKNPNVFLTLSHLNDANYHLINQKDQLPKQFPIKMG